MDLETNNDELKKQLISQEITDEILDTGRSLDSINENNQIQMKVDDEDAVNLQDMLDS